MVGSEVGPPNPINHFQISLSIPPLGGEGGGESFPLLENNFLKIFQHPTTHALFPFTLLYTHFLYAHSLA
jgi:hypothetical protein